MATKLDESTINRIYELADKGWDRREISNELKIGRDSIRRYLQRRPRVEAERGAGDFVGGPEPANRAGPGVTVEEVVSVKVGAFGFDVTKAEAAEILANYGL
jgi:hypothetical protein